jgi:hypothetical protein
VKRCAIYARYSSDLQSPTSIEDQQRLCRAFAERQGWTVVSAFEDAALSGFGIEHRPGYQQLLAAALGSPPVFEVLVAYSGSRARSVTIQVKTNLAPKPGGGKGAPGIDWWVGEDCPAELYAFVDLSTRRIWLFTKNELAMMAQQRSNGRLHFYMYTSSALGSLAYRRHGEERFVDYLFENRVSTLIG